MTSYQGGEEMFTSQASASKLKILIGAARGREFSKFQLDISEPCQQRPKKTKAWGTGVNTTIKQTYKHGSNIFWERKSHDSKTSSDEGRSPHPFDCPYKYTHYKVYNTIWASIKEPVKYTPHVVFLNNSRNQISLQQY